MTTTTQPATVLLTDYAWPDTTLERQIIEAAGYRLVTGPADPASEQEIDTLVREHRPQAIMTCWARVSAAAIASAPGLRIVARMGVGLDNIAVDAATQQDVAVTNVPDYCVEEVSDHAIAMLLAWARGIVHFDNAVKAGQWAPASARLRRVSSLTCGLVGYGRIGRRTAGKLQAFGVRVLAHSRSGAGMRDGVQFVALDELMAQSDAVIVQIPLTDSTRHLINRERLALMRPGSMLINVSRGAVADTEAVIEALASGRISATGLDVLETEPEVPAALRAQPGAILSPHVAFSSDESLLELRRRACAEVVRALRGEPLAFQCNTTA